MGPDPCRRSGWISIQQRDHVIIAYIIILHSYHTQKNLQTNELTSHFNTLSIFYFLKIKINNNLYIKKKKKTKLHLDILIFLKYFLKLLIF